MIDQQLAKTIDALRLPLCLGVVATHCAVLSMPSYDGEALTDILTSIPTLLLTSIRVPLFYMIAGYLAGVKYKKLDKPTYLNLIKKRTKSLLIPYLSWNLLGFIIREILRLSPIGSLTSGNVEFSSIPDFLTQLFWTPELVPLWFIRNLYLFYIGLPILYFLTKRFHLFPLVLFYILDEYAMCNGLFYFALGFTGGSRLSQEHVIKLISHRQILYLLFIAIVTAGFFFAVRPLDIAVVNVVIVLAGSAGFASVVRENLDFFKLASPGYVFYLYAIHGLLSPYVMKGLTMMFHPSGYRWILIYYAGVSAVIGISSILWFVSIRFCPKATLILTGNRKKRDVTPL